MSIVSILQKQLAHKIIFCECNIYYLMLAHPTILEIEKYKLRGAFERSLGHFTPFSLLFSILKIKVFIIIIIITEAMA